MLTGSDEAADAATGGLPRRYWTFAAGSTVSNVGGMLQRVIVGWAVWELTQSTFWIGIVASSELVPAVLLSPFAGALLDRVNILKVLAFTQVLGFVQAALLAAAVWTGHASLELILATTVVFAIANAFYGPALIAIVPTLVSRGQLAEAVSTNSILANASGFLAPLIAAQLLAHAGSDAGYGLNAASYLVLLAVLPLIRVAPRARSARSESYVAQIKAGYLYVARHPDIRLRMTSFAVVSVAARSLTFLMPAIAARLFHGGPNSLGMLLSAMAGGAVCGGIVIKSLKGRKIEAFVAGSVGASAALLLALALSSSLWLGTLITFGLGATLACNSISTQTAIQVATAEGMNGRVTSLFQTIFRAGPALGSFTAGVLAEVIGLKTVEIAFAMLIAVTFAALHLAARRKARRMASLRTTEPGQ